MQFFKIFSRSLFRLICSPIATYHLSCHDMLTSILAAITLIALTTSCKKTADSIPDGYKYSIPQVYADGLQTASLESVGMSAGPIEEMMDYLKSESLKTPSGHTIHNILIVRDNKLVFEEYFKGFKFVITAADFNGEVMDYTRTTDHYMASVSKSVTSVVFGIAVKEGYFNDLNKKIIDYLPQYSNILTGQKADITLQHLLTMTCGLAFDESTYNYGDLRNELRQALSASDPLLYILSKPLESTPGTHFHYSSGSGLLLAAILEKVTGMKFLDYANAKLFDPLRSEGGTWSSTTSGLIFASGGLSFKARELTKIGLLFLNAGQWEGKQIITPAWIALTQQTQVTTTGNYLPNSLYSYQWWTTSFTVKGVSRKCFYACGWGGQYMFIIPDLNLIIEMNAGNYLGTDRVSQVDLVTGYILRAIK